MSYKFYGARNLPKQRKTQRQACVLTTRFDEYGQPRRSRIAYRACGKACTWGVRLSKARMLGFWASPSSEARSSGPGPLPARVPALALGLQVPKDKQGQGRTRRGETYQQPGLNVGQDAVQRADGQLQVARNGAHPLPHANLASLLAADTRLRAGCRPTALYKGSAPLHAAFTNGVRAPCRPGTPLASPRL